MAVGIRRLHPVFVGEVDGVDLSRPLSAAAVAELEAGMDEYAVLVFRDQDITDNQQVAFSRNFGELEQPGTASKTYTSNLDGADKLLGRDNRQRMFNLGNRLWHSDSSFRAIPAKYSLLSARQVPARGGDTEFADMRAAYDALDGETKAEVQALVCEHSLIYSRGLLGFTDLSADEVVEVVNFRPVRQRLVRTHPVTGRKSLYLSAHAGAIVGWPVPEARALLRDLMEEATGTAFVYAHRWRKFDLVIWDNRQVMHRGRRFDDLHEVRDMRRTTVAGDAPTVEQVAYTKGR